MEYRVIVQWTETATHYLAQLPTKARRGLLTKADGLRDSGDPRKCCKPLTGPLQGYYRIVYGRYRAVFTAEEEELASGDILIQLKVRFVIAGIRKEHDRKDVYRVAERLVKLMLDKDETLGGITGTEDDD